MMDHVILSALDVANSINYLHSLGITHGDLKADNVLLKSANTDRRGFFCKVSDFGEFRTVESQLNENRKLQSDHSLSRAFLFHVVSSSNREYARPSAL